MSFSVDGMNEPWTTNSAFGRSRNPMVKVMQENAVEAMEYQLWASAQASSLAKLKLFHTMAKQVHEQQ